MSSIMKKDIDVGVADRDRTYFYAAAGDTLDLGDYLYYSTIICDTTGGAGTVKLPPVSEAKGLDPITIVLRTDGGSNITIADADDSEDWTDLTAADVNDTGTFQSDGTRWVIVENTGLA